MNAELNSEAKARAAKIRLLVLDVDGVCTNGHLWVQADGTSLKSFHSHDGIGIKTALKAGLEVGIITGRNDPSVEKRMQSLGVREYHPGHESKGQVLRDMAKRLNLSLDQVAYVGDDWIDIDPMRLVGFAIAVANARPEVKALAHHITRLEGGAGAVREAVEGILSQQTTKALYAFWTEQE